jgi:hypothetical protein
MASFIFLTFFFIINFFFLCVSFNELGRSTRACAWEFFMLLEFDFELKRAQSYIQDEVIRDETRKQKARKVTACTWYLLVFKGSSFFHGHVVHGLFSHGSYIQKRVPRMFI